jgi:hypothetical protein
MSTKRQTPAEAFRFAAEAAVDGDANDTAAGTFTGVAYSGDLISNHWYWGSVIFDLASTKAADRIPVLVQHDPDQRAGFASLEITDKITATGTLMRNTHGESVATESRAGFPWQMSVMIEPSSVEAVAPGATIKVNGRSVTGPANVFRNSTIREVSFTPVGADPGTSAQAMAHEFSDPQLETTMELQEALARIAALESDNQRLATEAKSASEALQAFSRARRDEAVRDLFSALGRVHTADAAAPYLAMDENTFSAVAADLRKLSVAKRPADSVLFSDLADGNTDTNEREQYVDAIAKFI